jgi:hypothetical protein
LARALRLRADSQINTIIGEVAFAERATLIDAERAIEPTNANFWEHVHMRPRANRRLAELVARELTGETRSANVPVTVWDEHRLTRTILAIVERPPFTPGHRQQITLPAQPAAPAEARTVWEQRVRDNPDDLAARERLAELDTELGDFRAAESSYRFLVARLQLRSWYTGLAESLLNQGLLRSRTVRTAPPSPSTINSPRPKPSSGAPSSCGLVSPKPTIASAASFNRAAISTGLPPSIDWPSTRGPILRSPGTIWLPCLSA